MNINIYNHKIRKHLEKIKWVSIFILLLIFFYIYQYIYNIHAFTRILIIGFFSIFIISLIFFTKKGKYILLLIKKSKNEMHHIIWPQYKETLYTTSIVISATIIMSFILWMLDSIIFYFITWIISLRF